MKTVAKTKEDRRERLTIVGAALDPKIVHEAFAEDVRAGLTASPRRLACRYFYDELGSQLFEEICGLPEYYIPRAETEILRAHAAEIAGAMPVGTELVELGSGSSTKTRLLLDAFLRRGGGRLRYLPIDISRTMLEESARGLLAMHEGLTIFGIAGEYAEGVESLARYGGESARLILWLGSNVGNFGREAAGEFLGKVRERMREGDRLLVGIDLRKDRRVLEAAYDDAQGVTARFNLNLLARVNRELGGDFVIGADAGGFRHRADYDEAEGRVRMWLGTGKACRVRVEELGLELEFGAGEEIHTEDSYKYSLGEIDALCGRAGLTIERRWFDAEWRFCEVLLAAG